MASLYNLIFFGLIISVFRLNIGGIDLFPSIIGYLIILYGVLSLDKGFYIKSAKGAKFYIFAIILLFPISYTLKAIFADWFTVYIVLGIIDIFLNLGLFVSIFEGAEDLYGRYGITWLEDIFRIKKKAIAILSIFRTMSLCMLFGGPDYIFLLASFISDLVYILYALSGLNRLRKDLYFTYFENME